MIAMTTKSSTKVKPKRRLGFDMTLRPLPDDHHKTDVHRLKARELQRTFDAAADGEMPCSFVYRARRCPEEDEPPLTTGACRLGQYGQPCVTASTSGRCHATSRSRIQQEHNRHSIHSAANSAERGTPVAFAQNGATCFREAPAASKSACRFDLLALRGRFAPLRSAQSRPRFSSLASCIRSSTPGQLRAAGLSAPDYETGGTLLVWLSFTPGSRFYPKSKRCKSVSEGEPTLACLFLRT